MYFIKFGTHSAEISKTVIFAGALAGWLFGGWNELLGALLLLNIIDLILGVTKAYKNKTLNSKKLAKGIEKKVGFWLTIVLANVIDLVLFDGQGVTVTATTFAFLASEMLSLAENLALMGVPIPKFIVKRLEQIREHSNSVEFEVGDTPDTPIDKVTIENKKGKKQVLHNDEDCKDDK